jgi:serine-type D-Ala-D-Ala carboxypeptidase
MDKRLLVRQCHGQRSRGLERIARKLIEDGVAPATAVGWAAKREGLWGRRVAGATTSYFDLASLTKPMTALAVAKSAIPKETPLADLVVEARGTPSADVPLELFLAHRAGLEAHLPLWEWKLPLEEALARVARARRADAQGAPPPAGFAPLYSDLGYVLAGVALARFVGARDAGEAIERLVIAPLGLQAELGTARALAGDDFAARVVPTEEVGWRGGVVRGAVHDENAWILTGYGGSGHAGIFGTIDGVVRFGCAARDDAPEWLVRPRPGGSLRAGFDGKSDEGSSAGSRMGARTYGHLGFTGTSLWIDPDAEVVVSVLTNRVHPSRDNLKIRAARPWAHDALFDLATAARPGDPG